MNTNTQTTTVVQPSTSTVFRYPDMRSQTIDEITQRLDDIRLDRINQAGEYHRASQAAVIKTGTTEAQKYERILARIQKRLAKMADELLSNQKDLNLLIQANNQTAIHEEALNFLEQEMEKD